MCMFINITHSFYILLLMCMLPVLQFYWTSLYVPCSFKRQQAPPTPNLSLSPKVETSWTLLDNTPDIFVEGYLDYDNFC